MDWDDSNTYQLVFQWRGADVRDFDELIDIEDAMIALLGPPDEVDGHDIGADECNIFIFTGDPARCLSIVEGAFAAMPWFAAARAGYRRLDHDEYTAVWPVGLERFDVS